MNKPTFLWLIKALILLSPIPFGCAGTIWTPLFYLLVLILSIFGINLTDQGVSFLSEKKIKRITYILFGFIFFQVLPLPGFLLKFLSPGTPDIIDVLKSSPPLFHAISVLPGETLGFGLRLFVMAFFFYAMVKIPLQKDEIFSLIHTLLLSSVIQTLFGLLKLFQGNTLFYLFFYKDPDPSSHLTGTIAYPDHFSFYLEMIFPLAIAMLLARILYRGPYGPGQEKLSLLLPDKKVPILYALTVLLIGSGIILTGSGTGITILLLSLFLLGSVVFYFSKSPLARRKSRAVFIVIITAVILLGMQKNLATFMNSTKGEMDYFTCWSNSVKLFSTFPLFGTGLGTFQYIYFLYDTGGSGWITHTHNDYLETFSEAGIVGGILFFISIGWVVVSLFRMWLMRENPGVKAIGLGVLVAGFSAGVHSFFGFAMRIPAISFLFVLILVIGIKMVSYKSEADNEI